MKSLQDQFAAVGVADEESAWIKAVADGAGGGGGCGAGEVLFLGTSIGGIKGVGALIAFGVAEAHEVAVGAL